MGFRLDDVVAYNLRTLRLDRNLTQGALASISSLSKQTISNIEKGQGASSRTLERLAEVMGISSLSFYQEVKPDVDIMFKRAEGKAVSLDKERYTAELEKAVDGILEDAKNKIYFFSVLPVVKDCFRLNTEKLLLALEAENSDKNHHVLLAFEDEMLTSIRQAITKQEDE